MKKHLILLKAMELYPFGTKFKSIAHNEECVSSGVFYFNEESESINSGLLTKVDNIGRYVYRKGIWAEIVKPKIAVKVENEKEFHALMKYYDGLGYFNWDEDSPMSVKYPLYYRENIISFEDKFVFPSNGTCEADVRNVGTRYDPKTYQIIPFSDFAKEHNIKLPLLTSEDGVDLYEGDEYFRACDIGCKGNNWSLVTISDSNDKSGFLESGRSFQKNDSIFSTKQAALDWIEAQKPKSIEFKLSKWGTAVISSDKIEIGACNTTITKKELSEIMIKMKELS